VSCGGWRGVARAERYGALSAGRDRGDPTTMFTGARVSEILFAALDVRRYCRRSTAAPDSKTGAKNILLNARP